MQVWALQLCPLRAHPWCLHPLPVPEGACQPRLSQVGSVVLCCHLVADGEKAGQSTAWVEGCIPDLGRSRDARWVGQGRHSGI